MLIRGKHIFSRLRCIAHEYGKHARGKGIERTGVARLGRTEQTLDAGNRRL